MKSRSAAIGWARWTLADSDGVLRARVLQRHQQLRIAFSTEFVQMSVARLWLDRRRQILLQNVAPRLLLSKDHAVHEAEHEARAGRADDRAYPNVRRCCG